MTNEEKLNLLLSKINTVAARAADLDSFYTGQGKTVSSWINKAIAEFYEEVVKESQDEI